MNNYRLMIGIGLVISIIGIGYFAGQVGFSFKYSTHKTLISCGTHPVCLLFGALIILAVSLLCRMELQVVEIGRAGPIRQFLCYFIDVYVLAIGGGSFLVLVPLELEARRTGHFAWYFVRDYSVPTDSTVFMPLILVALLIFALYIGYSLVRCKPTLGDFVTATFVVRQADEIRKFDWPHALNWPFWLIRGIWFSLYSLLMGRDWGNRIQHDRVFVRPVAHVKFQ